MKDAKDSINKHTHITFDDTKQIVSKQTGNVISSSDESDTITRILKKCGSTLGTEINADSNNKEMVQGKNNNITWGGLNTRSNHSSNEYHGISQGNSDNALSHEVAMLFEESTALQCSTRTQETSRRHSGANEFNQCGQTFQVVKKCMDHMIDSGGETICEGDQVAHWKEEAARIYCHARGMVELDNSDRSKITAEKDLAGVGENVRLVGIYGQHVVRPELNLEGMYNRISRALLRNNSVMEDIMQRSIKQLQSYERQACF
mmetsp:Transcript_2569/g.3675  ORF Transcript_2569/g.3675 Transcript_2569/m.3675 type:complete len:261 (-) Transcript_2569:1588-2370(-)